MKIFKKFAFLALAATMALSLTACGGSSVKGESPFADMDTVDLAGNAVTTADLADNKLTVINAWNLGCSACIEEMPALEQLSQEYADKGVAVMGLYYNFGEELSDADRQAIQDVMATAGASFPQLLVSEDMMATAELKQMTVFPLTYFVDAQGNIVDKVAGSNDLEGWKSTVDKVLEKVEG